MEELSAIPSSSSGLPSYASDIQMNTNNPTHPKIYPEKIRTAAEAIQRRKLKEKQTFNRKTKISDPPGEIKSTMPKMKSQKRKNYDFLKWKRAQWQRVAWIWTEVWNIRTRSIQWLTLKTAGWNLIGSIQCYSEENAKHIFLTYKECKPCWIRSLFQGEGLNRQVGIPKPDINPALNDTNIPVKITNNINNAEEEQMIT